MAEMCKKCQATAEKLINAEVLLMDIQALIKGFEVGDVTGSSDAKPFIVGLLLGVALTSGLSLGETPADAAEFTQKHTEMIKALCILSRNYQAGRIKRPVLSLYMQPWDGKDPDLAIPEELKWKPRVDPEDNDD